MPVYNLPPVTTELIDPDEIGTWEPLQGLDTLARALRLDRDGVRPQDLKSIPDAWAQVQLTSDALLDRDHDAHIEVRGQWRGLLTLFALQPSYEAEYSLDVRTIAMDPLDAGASRLRRVLKDLLPSATVAAEASWNRLGTVDVIRPDGTSTRSVAMLSPLTLLAPGRMLSNMHFRLPWGECGLADPTAGADLPAHEWHILVHFLQGLVTHVRGAGARAADVDDRERLIRELELFRDDCRGHVAGPAAPGPPELQEEQLHQDWPQTFFARLGSTFRVAGAGFGEATVVLPAAVSDGLFEGAILIDPELATTMGRPASAILVWKNITLAQASSPPTLARIKDEAAREGYLVLQPQDFFTERLVTLGSDAEVTAHPASLRNHLLPLAPTALLFFADTAELAENVTAKGKGDGLEVGLSLRVTPDEAGHRRRHVVRRAFQKSAILKAPPPDDLALWPDIESKEWPWTFMRFQYRPKSELQTRFAASAELISADLMKEDGRGRIERFAEWSSPSRLAPEARLTPDRISTYENSAGRTLMKRTRFADDQKIVGEQHQLAVAVQAICFSSRDSEKHTDLPVGLALVSRRHPAITAGDAVVSVDFGTTNTIGYSCVSGRNPERLVLKDRVFFPIEYRRKETELASAYTDFFCLQSHDTPIPTVAKRRSYEGPLGDVLRAQVENASTEIGVTHNIFFMPALDRGVDPFLLMQLIRKGQLEFNLKWGDTAKNKRAVQSFLHQLMVMAAAELADQGVSIHHIQWRFSHPQAFSRTQLTDFRDIINRSRRQMLKEAGQAEARENSLSIMTEGEAAAAYFIGDTEQANRGLGRLFVTLDIGGGTTDIAVRLDNRLVWRGSVQIAGSNFFRRYLVRNLDVLQAIEPAALKQLEERDEQAGAQLDPAMRREQLVDLIIAKPSFAHDFEQQYPLHRSEEAWAGLRHCATTALGGMMHYVGLVLRLLVDAGTLREEDIGPEITIALGGRGSTFFRTLDDGGADSQLARVCSIAEVAVGQRTDAILFLPRFSTLPKEEVARGLLLDHKWAESSKGVSFTRPLGLGLQIDAKGKKRALGPGDPLKPLLDADGVTDVDLTELETFLEALQLKAGLGIKLSSDAAANIQRLTRQRLAGSLSKLSEEDRVEADLQALEPPFVTALRLLIDVLSEGTAARRQSVTVRETEL